MVVSKEILTLIRTSVKYYCAAYVPTKAKGGSAVLGERFIGKKKQPKVLINVVNKNTLDLFKL